MLTSRLSRYGKNPLEVKVLSILLVISWLFLFFQAALQESIDSLHLIDEAITLMLIILALSSIWKHRFKMGQKSTRLCVFGLLLLITGILSTVIYGDQPLRSQLIDMFTSIKFLLVLICMLEIETDISEVISILTTLSKILITVMLFFLLLSQIADIGMVAGYRLGIASFKFCFPHPTYVVQALVGVIALLLVNPKANRIWILLGVLICMGTMRTKAFGYVVVALFCMLYSSGKRIGTLDFVLIGTALLLVGGGTLYEYYADPAQARALLLSTGFHIAMANFPLGMGFASFGTSESIREYSSVYYRYGLSEVHGLSPLTGNYATDSFWAALLGEYGFAGFTVFVGIVLVLFSMCYVHGEVRTVNYSVLSILLYLLLSSFGESAFFTPFSAVYLMFCFALLVKQSGSPERG